MRELAEAPFIDMFNERFRADPAGAIDAVRDQTSLVSTPVGCMVIGRDEVHHLLSDPRLQSSLRQLVMMQGVTEGPLYDLVDSAILSMDGPDHARIRRLVSRAFTPRSVEPYRAGMRELVDELIDGFAADGRCEFVTQFADHYPIQVICEVLGVPKDDHEDFARWGDAMTHLLSFELGEHLDTVTRAHAELDEYLRELVADRQAHPRDDLVSALTEASEDGDRLSPTELRSLIGGLLFAGYDTTRNQLGIAMTLFCDDPGQWKLLAEQPDLAAGAVDEIMRFDGAVSITPRLAAEELEIDGYRVPAGTLVALGLAAANHDPAAFADAESFDITAVRDAHFTFGGGPHYCLGASLAKAEMQEALPILARRMPGLALDGEVTWRVGTGIAGPTYLPLRFDPS